MDDLLSKLAAFQVRESAGSHCVLCGRAYDDYEKDDPVFVGEGDEGRSVHERCWRGFQALCGRLGLDWLAAVEQLL